MDIRLRETAFVYAKSKIERANRHIQEVEQWFTAYVNSDFYDILVDRDAQTGKQSLSLAVRHLPIELPLAMGDAFHCLSSALEYVMSGLMRAKTGDAARISFPTNESRKSLRDSFKATKPGKTTPPTRRIVEAFPLIALQLLTVIKSYKGGNHALWEIRKADNLDKHNLLIPTLSVSAVRGVSFIDEVSNIRGSGMDLYISAGGQFRVIGGYFSPDSQLKVTNKGEATASISFPDSSEFFAGDPVIPTLLKCSQLIAKAVDAIETTSLRYI